MKKYLIIVIAFITLLCWVSYLFSQNRKLQAEDARKSGNIETLMDTVKHYKVAVKNGDSIEMVNAASMSALCLTIDEFKKYRAGDAELIKELGIKNKYLESIAKVSTETKDTIPAEKWKLSKTLPDCLEYSDKWSHITACFKDSTVMYATRDSLAMVIHRMPKYKFLWFRWGTKGYRVEVVNFNPKSEIKYSEIVRVRK